MSIKLLMKRALQSYVLIFLVFIINIKFVHADTPLPSKLVTLKPGKLIVATYFTNPPFEFLKNGRQVGFEVDLIQEIAKRLNLTIEFQSTQWEEIIKELKQNKYDLIMGAITITPQRKKIIAFSKPYMTTTLSIIVNTYTTPHVKTLDDLHDSIVGVQAATTDYDIAIKMQKNNSIKGIKIYSFNDFTTAINDLITGKIGAVMKVFPVAYYYVQQHPELKILTAVPNDPQPLGFGFNQNNKELVKAINKVQTDIQVDGTYNKIYQHWFGN